MPCVDICKGLLFFFYLPLLPLWWTVEFMWGFAVRKWRRHKRKKRYRALKATQAEKEKDQYLSVDQYTRGKVEKQILGISKKVKDKKARRRNKGQNTHREVDSNNEWCCAVNAGFDAESQVESESTDTTDEDQV